LALRRERRLQHLYVEQHEHRERGRVRLFAVHGQLGEPERGERQVLGGTVNINNQFTMNYVPVKVPGAGEVTGFNEDIAYIREVKN